MRSGNSSSVTKLAQAARYREDDVLLRICEDGSEIVDRLLWHDTCYASYTSQQNIKHSANATEPPKDQQTSKRVQRSDKDQIDWSKCFICKKRSYKKKTELINVSTFEACQSVKKAATNNGDEDMMRFLIGIKDDLIAAEAKYHKNCYALYISTKSPHVRLETQTSDTDYDNAFQRLAEDLKHGLDERQAFDMASLLARYNEFLLKKGVAGAESYSMQRLKDRLRNFFGEEIVFHQQLGRAKPELIYSSNVNLQDVINAWALSQTIDKTEVRRYPYIRYPVITLCNVIHCFCNQIYR